MSDDLIDRLRMLPPPLPAVPDRVELVRRRMVRRRRRLVAAGSAFGLGIASVGTAVALTAGGLHTFSPQPAGSATSCPKSLGGTAPVPRAAGVDATSRLVPAAPSPKSAFICTYAGSTESSSNKWKLSGRRTLHDGLSQLVNDLTWIPPRIPGVTETCSGWSGPTTDYLLSLSYPNGGRLWVASSGLAACGESSNGAFVASGAIGAQLSASYLAGRWQPAPAAPSNACQHGYGRLGQQSRMVPGAPVTMHVCRTVLSHGRWVNRDVAVDRDFGDLVSALNAKPTTPFRSLRSCRPSAVGQAETLQSRSYDVLFNYREGPPVHVEILTTCEPAVDNDTLAANGSTTVVPLLERYFHTS